MTGYVRQSTAEIATGEIVLAAPVNAEFNRLQSAFNSTTGHLHDGSTGNGPPLDLADSTTGVLPANRGGTGVTSVTADDMSYFTSSTEGATIPTEAYGRGLLNYDSEGAFKVGTNLEIGVDVQAYSANLTTLAGLGADARTALGLTINTDVQAYDAGLAALASFNTNGVIVQSADNTFVGRTITGTTNQITITDGSGVAGNPTIAFADSVIFPKANTDKMVNIADTSTPSIAAADGNIFICVATGNPSLSVSDTPINGQKILIVFKASGGDRTLSLDTGDFAMGDFSIVETLSGETDFIACVYLTVVGKFCVVGYSKGYA